MKLNFVKFFQSFFSATALEQRPTGYSAISPYLSSRTIALDQEAVVSALIQPHKSGRVKFRGSWWPARCQQNVTLQPGEVVYVVGRCNITLLVEPFSESE